MVYIIPVGRVYAEGTLCDILAAIYQYDESYKGLLPDYRDS